MMNMEVAFNKASIKVCTTARYTNRILFQKISRHKEAWPSREA